jgi:predicted dinucleotide-binding enzyme
MSNWHYRGVLGSNVARLLAKSRISATIANKHGPESLGRLVRELGSRLCGLDSSQ